jgi:hypothetical protein
MIQFGGLSQTAINDRIPATAHEAFDPFGSPQLQTQQNQLDP